MEIKYTNRINDNITIKIIINNNKIILNTIKIKRKITITIKRKT